MECHKCPHDGKGSAACLSCRPTRDDAHGGKSFVSLDALHGTSHEPRVSYDPARVIDGRTRGGDAGNQATAEGGGKGRLSRDEFEGLGRAMAQLLSLSPNQMYVVARRWQAMNSTRGKPTFAEIGRDLGISKQAAKQAMDAAVAKFPELANLFNYTSNNKRFAREDFPPMRNRE